jgi:hypothetical protein
MCCIWLLLKTADQCIVRYIHILGATSKLTSKALVNIGTTMAHDLCELYEQS